MLYIIPFSSKHCIDARISRERVAEWRVSYSKKDSIKLKDVKMRAFAPVGLITRLP